MRYVVKDGGLEVDLADGTASVLSAPEQLVGHVGDPRAPDAVFLSNKRLVVELVIDRDHPVGRNDPAGVADVIIESAVSVIMDCEDSVSAVDAEDKVVAYRNWLGLTSMFHAVPAAAGPVPQVSPSDLGGCVSTRHAAPGRRADLEGEG